jgi:hypothetical protein
MNGNWNTFENKGYMVFKLPDEVLEVFTDVYQKIKSKSIELPPHNYKLVGHIKEEYSLEHLIENSAVNTALTEVASAYMQFFNISPFPVEVEHEGTLWDIKMKQMWINIQKKYEYNPAHNHGGVLSFVIWLKIPYNVEEERAVENSPDVFRSVNGRFMFHPTNILGDTLSLSPKNNEYQEGNIAIFPSRLNHSVYPFYTSNDDRVSISGNFYYTLKETK